MFFKNINQSEVAPNYLLFDGFKKEDFKVSIGNNWYYIQEHADTVVQYFVDLDRNRLLLKQLVIPSSSDTTLQEALSFVKKYKNLTAVKKGRKGYMLSIKEDDKSKSVITIIAQQHNKILLIYSSR